MRGHVILSHGSDSSPEATKVSALARVAEALGLRTERPDFAACDARGHVGSVAPRVALLVERMRAAVEPSLLVGSSMGAYASALASRQAPCAGLFLLALPSDIPGCGQPLDMARDVPTMAIHGYADEVCPFEPTLAFLRAREVPCLMVPDGHRLADHLDTVVAQFRLFLGARIA